MAEYPAGYQDTNTGIMQATRIYTPGYPAGYQNKIYRETVHATRIKFLDTMQFTRINMLEYREGLQNISA
jgi:hypothetical protein